MTIDRFRFRTFGALAALLLLAAGNAAAQNTIRCESQSGRTQYCDIGYARDVRLERQLSRGECTEGYTWGFDQRGLWVSRGCRAEFSVW